MQQRQCDGDPRDVVTSCVDVIRATAEYAAGYADGVADSGG
jgi:hypothetical protein